MLNELEEGTSQNHQKVRKVRDPEPQQQVGQMVDEEDESSPWEPAALYSQGNTLFRPVKLSLKDQEVQANIQRIEEFEGTYHDQYAKDRQQVDGEGTNSRESRKNSKKQPKMKRAGPSQENPDIRAENLESESEGEGSSQEDLPKEAKEWRAHYYQDDMEILYDPVEDYTSEAWVNKNVKGEHADTRECVVCNYCFVPVCFGPHKIWVAPAVLPASIHPAAEKSDSNDPVRESADNLGFQRKSGKIEAFLCKETKSTVVSLTSLVEHMIGDDWKALQCEDETYKDFNELLFDVSCANCENLLGVYLANLETHVLCAVVEGNC